MDGRENNKHDNYDDHEDSDDHYQAVDIENVVRKEARSNASSFSERDMREPLLMSRMNNTSQIAIVGANVYPIESLDYEYDFFYFTCLLILI